MAIQPPEPMNPLVSVVIPVHNGERYLNAAIESVRNQTLRNLELLLVENGSTDSSIEILRRHERADPRIRVLTSKDIGSANAMNHGIASARARWVARLDQDDIAMPNRLERQLDFVRANPDVMAVGTWGYLIGENGRIVGVTKLGADSRDVFRQRQEDGKLIYLLSPATMFARDLALHLGGFREEYFPADDVDLWSRIADEHVVLAIPEPLIGYRIHAKATSTQRFAEQMEKSRWASANIPRRRSGLPELRLEEHRYQESLQPVSRRIRRDIALRSQVAYRRGGGLLAAGKPQGLVWLGLSFVLSPGLPVGRLRRQAVWTTLINGVWQRRTHVPQRIEDAQEA